MILSSRLTISSENQRGMTVYLKLLGKPRDAAILAQAESGMPYLKARECSIHDIQGMAYLT